MPDVAVLRDIAQQLAFDSQAQCAVFPAQGFVAFSIRESLERFCASCVLVAEVAKGFLLVEQLQRRTLDTRKPLLNQLQRMLVRERACTWPAFTRRTGIV